MAPLSPPAEDPRTDLDEAATGHDVAAPGSRKPAASKWALGLRIAFSAAILGAILIELRRLDLHRAGPLVPRSPIFWLFFLAYYATPIVGDWIIFRRLWRIPASAVRALAYKLVSNELLLGYSGEAWFLAWAGRNLRVEGSRFGTIKDVSILSALAGNGLTLAMVVAVWPLLRTSPLDQRLLDWAILFVACVSFVAALVQRRFLSLSRRDLFFVFAVQLARITATTALGLLLWHLALPGAKGEWLLVLAALRLLVSRVPFLPNKDLAFAGLTLVLLGPHAPLAATIAMIATFLLGAHLIVGAALALADLAQLRRPG
jgi:hypothetical protein